MQNNEKFTGKTAEFQQNGMNINMHSENSSYQNSSSQSNSSFYSSASELSRDLSNSMGKIGQAISHNLSEPIKRQMIEKKLRSYGDDQIVLGTFGSVGSLILFLVSIYSESPLIGSLVSAVALLISGTVVTIGLGKKKQGKRFVNYWKILGNSKQFSMEKLANISSESTQTLYRDMDAMLHLGVFKKGFLDRQNGTLVLDNVEEYIQHYSAPVVVDVPNNAALPPVEEHTFLQEIRQINGEINNPKLSQQIDQIGMITGKIVDFQEKNKNKDRELHSFFSYYLPTTLKILRSYAQLEKQNIEGDNISKSKAQIETMMDKVVEGFEKQLDQLFQKDTMDIATDISVLEQMFEKDGLSASPLRLEHSAPVKPDENLDITLKL